MGELCDVDIAPQHAAGAVGLIATTDWSYYESANEPAQFWEPLLLPTDFAAVNLSSGAMSYFKPPDGSEWLAIGGHGLLLCTKDPTPTAGPTP